MEWKDNTPQPMILEPCLSRKVIRGGSWIFLLRMAQQLIHLVKIVILARVLSPHDFGLMGIAILTIAALETFSQTGFQQTLIQKKDDIKAYLDTTWTALLIRGVVLFFILYTVASYAAVFFGSAEGMWIIRATGFSLLIESFSNIGVVYFQKELKFNKQFIYQLSETLTDFIVAVFCALTLRNVWALVLGFLGGRFIRCIVSYAIHPHRPKLNFHLKKVKGLFGFGKWVLFLSLIHI